MLSKIVFDAFALGAFCGGIIVIVGLALSLATPKSKIQPKVKK